MDLYHSTDADGISLVNPTNEQMGALIQSLKDPDIDETEYPDISLTHNASGFSITLFPSGIATMENLEAEDESPLYLSNVTEDQAMKLWQLLAAGDFPALNKCPWRSDS